MDFDMNFYQKGTNLTAVYPADKAIEYLTLGLMNEAGEVGGKVKKALRGDKPLDKDALASELGDVMWYLSELATQIGYPLADIARMNLAKLDTRKQNGTLKGDGDNR